MKANPSQAASEILLPETHSRRALPVNLQQKDLVLFEHELEKVIPPTRLLELRNVRISSDGLLFNGLRLMPESFAFPYLLDEWRRRSFAKFFIKNHLVQKRRWISEDAAWIVDYWSTGYFHWLADALTRLYVIKDRLAGLLLLLPNQYRSLEFVRPSLKAFGVEKFEYINQDEVIACDRLFLPTPTAPSGDYNEATIKGVREVLLQSYGKKTDSDERIYISRSRATKRRVVNEDEVVAVLQSLDFTVIRAEDYSFEEQVAIASAARYLVSNHGAGLSNMLFMKTYGKILELRHETDSVNNCYFNMASALKLNYFYQSCQSEQVGEDAHTANLVVDLKRLRENIEQMLGVRG
jgi:capsular polysaccharide biosynthesis protein